MDMGYEALSTKTFRIHYKFNFHESQVVAIIWKLVNVSFEVAQDISPRSRHFATLISKLPRYVFYNVH